MSSDLLSLDAIQQALRSCMHAYFGFDGCRGIGRTPALCGWVGCEAGIVPAAVPDSLGKSGVVGFEMTRHLFGELA